MNYAADKIIQKKNAEVAKTKIVLEGIKNSLAKR